MVPNTDDKSYINVRLPVVTGQKVTLTDYNPFHTSPEDNLYVR